MKLTHPLAPFDDACDPRGTALRRQSGVRSGVIRCATLILGCGGSEGPKAVDNAAELCAGIASFDDPQEMMADVAKRHDEAQAAETAYGWVVSACPDQLRNSDDLRAWLIENGVDPDGFKPEG